MRRTVYFGSRAISYELDFAPTRRLSISVHPDLRVTAVAPAGRSLDEVDARVRARAAWVLAQLRDFERYHPRPVPRRFVSGETHRYLGRQYRLKVVRGPGQVALSAPYIRVGVPDRSDAARIAALMDRWYRERASAVFARRFTFWAQSAPSLQADEAEYRVRRMARRWGSCAPSGVITLTPDLVAAPTSCIDYVIVHELCHRKVMAHGRRFYALLSRYVPDWERRQERLNQVT